LELFVYIAVFIIGPWGEREYISYQFYIPEAQVREILSQSCCLISMHWTNEEQKEENLSFLFPRGKAFCQKENHYFFSRDPQPKTVGWMNGEQSQLGVFL
jgi:hypothetical protein